MTDKQQSSIMFVISITTAIVAILVPIFTYRTEIVLNKKDIDYIKADRITVWDKQDKLDSIQTSCLAELKEITARMDEREKLK